MKKPALTSKDFSALGMSFQLAYTIIIPLILLTLLGLYLDNHFQTKPLFIFAGMILAIIISCFGVYKIVLPYLSTSKKEDQKNKK